MTNYDKIIQEMTIKRLATEKAINSYTVPFLYGNTGDLDSKDYTRDGEQIARDKAVKAWNRRVNNELAD